ncbi:MAG TPA: hypothetical protein VGA00_13180 [Acidiferrobacterales bacterium]
MTIEGDVPVAYVKRSIEAAGNPTDSLIFRAGGDLYIREKSSPSAPERNVTAVVTRGTGDVSDPEVSYDGKKLLFAMKCGAGTTSAPECYGPGPTPDRTWNIWEYDIEGDSLRRIIPDNAVSSLGDDVDPAYLPDGGIVFSSNRQATSFQDLGYKYLDEYEREPTIVLHTMNADDGEIKIKQISFNMSHDRNPTVLSDGTIMFSRWDHVGNRNHFTIFTVNADGTNLFIKYGAHNQENSPGDRVNSFLHPREMQDGRVMSDGMPLSGTRQGGALLVIDIGNFAEHDEPKPGTPPGAIAQYQPTSLPVPVGPRAVSENGRYTTPYPLWDGTHRALVAFTPGGRTEIVQERSLLDGSLRDVTREKHPAYGVYMYDLNKQSFRPVALPDVDANGEPINMITDPVAIMARPSVPRAGQNSAVVGPAAATGDTGRLVVKSVYDTDHRGRMGGAMLTADELAKAPIPRSAGSQNLMIPAIDNATVPCSSTDSRARYPNCDKRRFVADIARLKNPAPVDGGMPPDHRPARFVRVTKAVPQPDPSNREAIGDTDFEMQHILGYAEVEPDGSLNLEVPANTPLALAVLDAEGRAFQTHTSWLQVHPGENVACKGCHSPRAGSIAALNIGTLASADPNSALRDAGNNLIVDPDPSQQLGDTMAETRSRLDPTANPINPDDIGYRDVWTANHDMLGNPLAKGMFRSIRYDGATIGTTSYAGLPPAEMPAKINGAVVINFPEHIQPILNRRCGSCHGPGGSDQMTLDLSDSPAGTGRLASYEALVVGKPRFVNGLPDLVEVNGEIILRRLPALVNTMAGNDGRGLARSSHLIERLYGAELLANGSPNDGLAHTVPVSDPANHAALLTPSERRVLVEWVDLGGQYYNDPCRTRDANGRCTTFRAVSGLNARVFTDIVQPLMEQDCAGCHFAAGRDTNDTEPFQAKRLVLTGSEGDFNVTVSMVTDACNAANSLLLRYPTSTSVTGDPLASPPLLPHPQRPDPVTGVMGPALTAGSPTYNAIADWIAAARGANGCP